MVYVWPEGATMRLNNDGSRSLVGSRVHYELTPKGQAEVESDALRFLRRRVELSGRLSLIEQAYWQRDKDQQQDTSSAQPHRFRSAE